MRRCKRLGSNWLKKPENTVAGQEQSAMFWDSPFFGNSLFLGTVCFSCLALIGRDSNAQNQRTMRWDKRDALHKLCFGDVYSPRQFFFPVNIFFRGPPQCRREEEAPRNSQPILSPGACMLQVPTSRLSATTPAALRTSKSAETQAARCADNRRGHCKSSF